MRLKKEQIERIARLIVSKLKEKKLITMRVGENLVLSKVVDVIVADLHAEDKLESDAKDMLDQYAQQAGGDLDRFKMLQMIKKQLAKERKIVL